MCVPCLDCTFYATLFTIVRRRVSVLSYIDRILGNHMSIIMQRANYNIETPKQQSLLHNFKNTILTTHLLYIRLTLLV